MRSPGWLSDALQQRSVAARMGPQWPRHLWVASGWGLRWFPQETLGSHRRCWEVEIGRERALLSSSKEQKLPVLGRQVCLRPDCVRMDKAV